MAEDPRSWKRWPLRHRVAAAILAALPLLAVGGALLPGVVEVKALGASSFEDSQIAVEALRYEEILVPRNFWTDIVPELNELASLFVDVAAVSQTLERVATITGILATERDLILFPAMSAQATSLHTTVVSVTPPVGAPGEMAPVLEDRCKGNVFCFAGASEISRMLMVANNTSAGAGGGPAPTPAAAVPVPEPSSASLVALGLLALVAARRRA